MRTPARAASQPEPLSADQAAWLALVPTAALVLAAMMLLGPTLGSLLLPGVDLTFWNELDPHVRPESTEQARFLIALTAPPLHVAITLLLLRRWGQEPFPGPTAVVVRGIEIVTVVALVTFFVVQRLVASATGVSAGRPVVYFTMPTVVIAIVIAIAMIAAIRDPRVRARVARLSASSQRRGRLVALIALAAVAITMVPAISTDDTVMRANPSMSYHLAFIFDESMAVLDGRSPLGDFVTQYAALLPYVLAGAMHVLGTSVLVFTCLLVVLTGAVLLSFYDVLRRVTRSPLIGLLVFLPVMATCAYRLHGPVVNRFSLLNYFGVLPLRYAGPLLLAWLVARHLDGSWPRRTWPLFFVGAVAALNNTDFGIAAIGATVAALLLARRATSLRSLAGEAAVGLAAGVALVFALLWIRIGAPPDLSLLFDYARVFVRGGFAMVPIHPVVGMSTVIFLTYAIAIGVAAVRAIRDEPDRLMTGLLGWFGVFGLGVGSYYVGHSMPELVIFMFPCWAMTVALLTIIVARRLAAQPLRRPTPIDVACLCGFGLLVCSLGQTPLPWSQAQRLSAQGPRLFERPAGQGFVAAHTELGEPVVIFTSLGHRIAANLGIDNVERYTGSRSVQTEQQLRSSLDALRSAGGSKVFVWPDETWDDQIAALRRTFEMRDEEPRTGMELWVRR